MRSTQSSPSFPRPDYLLGRADDPEGHAVTFDEPLFRDFKKVESETDRDSIRMLTDALLQRQEKGKKRDG